MPIVRPSVTDSWRGRSGNSQSSTPNRSASEIAYDVFERNSIETRSMFAMMRRPSATTPGRCENLPSRSTRRATAFVAVAPDSMAMPRSASLMASASLTPSPVMATVWPESFSACTISRFWVGVTRPNTR